jgi:hypothetical protein
LTLLKRQNRHFAENDANHYRLCPFWDCQADQDIGKTNGLKCDFRSQFQGIARPFLDPA